MTPAVAGGKRQDLTPAVVTPAVGYARDDGAAATSEAALRELARQPGQAITYTCMPTGWAPRL